MENKKEFSFLDRYRSIFAVGAVALLIPGVLILFFMDRSAALISGIEVYNNTYLSSHEIIEASRLKTGIPATESLLKQATDHVLELPSVESARIEYGGNGILEIRVREKQCAAIVRIGKEMIDVDHGLVVLSSTSVRCSGVPVIAGRYPIKDGRIKSERLERLIESLEDFRRDFSQVYRRISEIRMEGGGNLTIFLAGKRIRIRMHGDFTEKNSRRLYAALSYFEKKGSAGVIDLRGPDAILLPEL